MRLPRTALPCRYEIHLTPDFAAERFAGTVRVTLDVREPVRELVCHAAGLAIGPAELGGQPVEVRLEPDLEQVRFLLPAPVDPGRYELALAFSGAFDRTLKGFFYRGGVASTQFQSTDARRAFPCWDEPDMKAVFAVTLDAPPGCMAVSNGPVRSETELPDGWRRVGFADTPVMSTYLVAFVIGPLETTETVDVDSVALRVVHVPGKGLLARYGLEVGAHALRFFSAWTGVPYPGEKLDLIAVPERGGAMENLGAAIFVESALLIDAERAAPAELERIASVVSHEIAHMWFGDLVTMRWWDGLWLNEAFATFITVHCLEDFRPDWRNWVAFGAERERAMAVDALPSTRPVEFPVERPDEAEAMYDVLTYQKGAALLRMLEGHLGPEAFRAGVSRFLREHAFGNADGDDLWASWGQEVAGVMRPWVVQGGFPRIDVDRSADGTLTLTQQPPRWVVPCRVGDRQVLVGAEPVSVPQGVVNAGGYGYFRVRYRQAPDLEGLTPIEQFGLFADTWACALADLVPLKDFLALRLGSGSDPVLFTVLDEALTTFDHAVAPAARARLRAWTGDLLAPILGDIGWTPRPGEDPRIGGVRSLCIRALGNIAEDPTAIARALASSDTSAAVLAVQAAHGSLEPILAGFRRAADPQDEQRHLEALAACRDPAAAAALRAMCLTELKAQQAGQLLSRMMASRHTGSATWSFVRAHWAELLPRFFGKGFWRMLAGAGWLLECQEDVRAFLQAQDLGGMRRLADQIVESLELRAAFARREGDRLLA